MRTVRTIVLWLLAMLPAAASQAQTVLYDFYAEWCGACRQMSAAVDAIAGDGYAVERINVDQQPALARQYAVTSIPCFVVVERGKEVDRIVGQTSIERLKLKLKLRQRPAMPTDVSKKDPQRPATSIDVNKNNPPERRPHPAWRYEQPVGHRAAVVRIYCQDDVRTRSIGSGTLVKWGAKKIVVLTARHVIQDAKRITVEFFNKKTCKAHVLKVDAVWDCAVLELESRPEGVTAAEVELGRQAMQREGNRLESCGCGPDGKLAVNTGLFLGYKRSTQTPNGPDDWFEISGHARPGDSGGGVFNERGRLVGVLWGTNGNVVVGVQAGRLHLLLDAATGVQQRSFVVSADRNSNAINFKDFTLLQYQRRPTPPKACQPGSGCCPPIDIGDLPQTEPVPGPIFDEPAEPTAGKERAKPVLPWRGEAQQRDEELNARTRNLLEAIEAERRARLAAEATAGGVVEQPKPEPKKEEPSPLLAAIVILGSLTIGGFFYSKTKKNPS